MIKRNGYWLVAASLVLICSAVSAQTKSGGDFDVQHYQIDAELIPQSQVLRARAEVRFVPLTDTRSVVFELNGSLTVKGDTISGELGGLTPANVTMKKVP